MNVPRFNIFYDAPDYERDIAFYRDVLGIPIKMEYDDGHKCGTIFEVNDYVEFELMGPGPNAEQTKPPPTGIRLKFMVDDLDVEYERLKAADVTIIQEPTVHSWGERSFGVQAPDGLTIYFYRELETET